MTDKTRFYSPFIWIDEVHEWPLRFWTVLIDDYDRGTVHRQRTLGGAGPSDCESSQQGPAPLDMRAKKATAVSAQYAAEKGGAQNIVPLPPVHWFVRGPRGGIYMATGERTREVTKRDMFAEEFFWVPPKGERWWVIDASEDVKYVRPGTKLHRQARIALD